MSLPIDLLPTLRARRARQRLATDADTLHGVLLMIEERRAHPSQLAVFYGFDGSHFSTLMTAARNGSIEVRVPAWRGTAAGQDELAGFQIQKRDWVAAQRALGRRVK